MIKPKPKLPLSLPAVVLAEPKYVHNLAGMIRACSCWGAPTLMWTGNHIDIEKLDRLPREERMKGYRDVTWFKTERPLDFLPKNIVPVCVEVFDNSECLTTFEHPENAVYVFGPENGSVNQMWRTLCHRFVHIPTHHCLNLSQAVNFVLGHRRLTRQLKGIEPILPLDQMLHEQRGRAELDNMMFETVGWDGK